MDDDGSLGFRNWGYYEQPLKGNLGLQLMPGLAERDKKPLLSNGGGGFLHRECAIPEPSSMPIDFVRDGWIHHARENKLSHMIPMNHHNHNHNHNHNHHHHSYSVMPPDPVGGHTLQMIQQQQQPEPPKEDNAPPQSEEPKKRPQARTNKSPKPKKPKKAAAPRDEASGCPVSRTLVINGIDLDISGIPTPVCSCTGAAQQCYKWGAGGWQSACCTTNMSEYPLPMSTKRRGARIAGRKMSLGAFKKVLEKLAGEGYNLSNPIDLKTFWAKHGTNKFATIR